MAISGQTRMTVQPCGEQVHGACSESGVRILPLLLSASAPLDFSVPLLSRVWNGSNSSTYTKAYCDHTEGPRM